MIASQSTVPARGFRAVAHVAPAPLFREPPGPREPYLEFLDTKGFRCFIHRTAVEQMAHWARQAEPNETLGLLAGRLCTDNQGIYLVIHDAVHSDQRSAGPGHVHADWQAQEATRRALERECRLLEAVGWWHTHPGGIGLFYSGTDRANQRTWSSPHAVGLVLDPGLHREGMKVYRGPESAELKVGRPLRHRRLLDAVGRRLSRRAVWARAAVEQEPDAIEALTPGVVSKCACCHVPTAERWLGVGVALAWLLVLLVAGLALIQLASPPWPERITPPAFVPGWLDEAEVGTPEPDANSLQEEDCAWDGSG